MDAFRDKQRESIIAAATSVEGSPTDPDTVAIPPQFQMRIGKQTWETYCGRGGRKQSATADEEEDDA